MQLKFTLKRFWDFHPYVSLLFILFFLFAGKVNSQAVIYQTPSTNNSGAQITPTTSGPATSLGDNIVLGGTNRFVTQVEIRVFTLTSTAPVTLNLAMYTQCSGSTTTSTCGSGPGILVPGSSNAVTITPPATGTSFLVTFNYATPVDLTGEADNQINVVVNSSRNDVYWFLCSTGQAPLVGSNPPGEPATGWYSRCGSTTGNNGCDRAFIGVQNNFDIKITAVASLVPCTGTPNPGNTLSSSNPVCAGVNFNLSTVNSTPGVGVGYQWQTSPDGTTWTNVVTGINATYTTIQTTATYYRVRVTCGANSTFSTGLQVTMSPFQNCYCASSATFPEDEDIFNVSIGSLNNSSTCTSVGPGPGSIQNLYSNYRTLAPATIVYGNMPFSVQIGTCGGNFTSSVAIWIDYNQNGSFEASEKGYSGVGFGPHTQSGTIVVPASALPGVTGMRVVNVETGDHNGILPCGTYPWGETEDYLVTIQPCVTGVVTTHPANATVACSANTSFAVATTGSILSYSWEFRVNASSPWQIVTNTGVYSGATTNRLTLSNVPASMSGYQYRAGIAGPCTAPDFSNAATLTITPLVATVSPTAATICTGSIQQLTLTNASSPTTVTFTNNTPLAIPDNTPAGVFSTIAVSGIPAGAILTEVSVRLNISHTFVGDLEINLIAPNAGNMNLIGELNGGTGSNSSDNFINTVISSLGTTPLSGAPAPRTGTFAADRLQGYGPSGAFQTAPNGVPWSTMTSVLNGNWVLGLSDWFNLDIGTLNNWSITFTYGAPSAGVWTASPATPNTMFTDPAATVPYVAGSLANTIYVKPTVNNSYSVVYSTATPCTSGPTTVPVTVINPVGTVTQPANRSACVGSDAVFTASATGGPNTYQWQVSTDGGTNWTNISGATASTLTVSGVTSSMNNYRYRAVFTAAPCAGSTNSNAAILTVNPLPTVTLTSPDLNITPGQSTTLTATSNPAAAANGYLWTLNGNTIAGTSNTQVVRVDGFGAYQVRVTDINGCVSTSAALNIGAEASDRLWIYPNPTPGPFQVRLYYGGTVAERRVVSIFASNGQLVMKKEFTLTNATSPYLRMDFDLTNWASGTYVVKVDNRHTGNIVSGLVVVNHN